MAKKINIVTKALEKLKLMQMQLTEESQVLDELKAEEDADEHEIENLRSELNARNDNITALNDELKKRGSENAKLGTLLENGAEELKALLGERTALKGDLEKSLSRMDELSAFNQRLLHSLEEKERVYKNEVEAARYEAAGREELAASLREELKKLKEENEALSHELMGRAVEAKAAVERERADFRLSFEKLETAAAGAEKALLKDVETLKESLRQTAAEAARSGAEIQTLLDRDTALKEELKKQKEANGELSRVLMGKTSEFKAATDKERADFRLNFEKLENVAAGTEMTLLKEVEALKESLRHNAAETARLGAEGQSLLDRSAALEEELKKQKEENEVLSRKLMERASEVKAAVEKERADFRLSFEKLENAAAGTETTLLKEVEALKESLRQKAAEAARSGAESQTLLNRIEALKADYEGRLLVLAELNASIKDETEKEKAKNEALVFEIRNKTAEFNAVLESERAKAKTLHAKDKSEISGLNEAGSRLADERDEAVTELKKIKDLNAAIKAQRDASLVRITEQDVFFSSATSALREKEEDLLLLKNRMENLQRELSKSKADSQRRQEILRLELDEKKRYIHHLDRELEKSKAEKETLKMEIAEREKLFNVQLEKERKELRPGPRNNTGTKNTSP